MTVRKGHTVVNLNFTSSASICLQWNMSLSLSEVGKPKRKFAFQDKCIWNSCIKFLRKARLFVETSYWRLYVGIRQHHLPLGLLLSQKWASRCLSVGGLSVAPFCTLWEARGWFRQTVSIPFYLLSLHRCRQEVSSATCRRGRPLTL